MKIHLLTKSSKIPLSVTQYMCEDLASESFKNQFTGDFFCLILLGFLAAMYNMQVLVPCVFSACSVPSVVSNPLQPHGI